MVRSRAESEWDDEQRGLMLALAEVRRGECQCGHPLSESTDPANEGRYRVDPPTRCHACHAIAAKQAEYEKTVYPQALRFGAYLKPS